MALPWGRRYEIDLEGVESGGAVLPSAAACAPIFTRVNAAVMDAE